ncbi:MAG: type II secretion system protein [Acholeplasmataceae bacterium]|nr:type II secretion system protein [Acholeplasmataceae bacterium]
MNKKGVTLIEMLAAIVIFSLALSLAATVISLINNASARIEINSQANYQGLLIDRQLKDAILDFAPTNYSNCGGQNCYVLEKEFTYEFDANLGQIVLTTYSPALTHQLNINNGEILINNVPLVIDDFTLGDNSDIDILQNGTQVYLTITYELIATSGKAFTFTTSYSFAILAIPTP